MRDYQSWTLLLVVAAVASLAASRLNFGGMKSEKKHRLFLQTSMLSASQGSLGGHLSQTSSPIPTPGSISSDPVALPFDLYDLSLPLWHDIDGLVDHWRPSHSSAVSSIQTNKSDRLLAIFLPAGTDQELSFLQQFAGFSSLYQLEEGIFGRGRPTQIQCFPMLR